MATALIANAVATIGSLITGITNYFTDMFLTPPLKATLKHLEETELKTLQGGERNCERENSECGGDRSVSVGGMQNH